MEKYSNLEQALQDPSLAIITDRINTHSELNKVYVKYKVLPKRQKRFSNYYSNKFLDHNVPEMYDLVKTKLNAESGLFEDLELPNESFILSEPDLYYKEESFNSGDTNICFILGHSGSGKSMMARTLEGHDIDHIELDDLLLTRDHFTMDETILFFNVFTPCLSDYSVNRNCRPRGCGMSVLYPLRWNHGHRHRQDPRSILKTHPVKIKTDMNK